MKNDALRVAASLHSLGVNPRSVPPVVSTPEVLLQPVVMIHLPNCIPFATLAFGIFVAGLTATMANPALAPFELKWIMESAKPSVVVTTREGFVALDKATKELPIGQRPGHVFVVDLEHDTYGLPDDPTAPGQTQDWKCLLSISSASVPSTPHPRPMHFSACSHPLVLRNIRKV